jgi:hypothetical protein
MNMNHRIMAGAGLWWMLAALGCDGCGIINVGPIDGANEGEGEGGEGNTAEGEGDGGMGGEEGEGDGGMGGEEGEGEGEGDVLPGSCQGNAAAEATFDVYERMKPACVGCHGAGTSKPYFTTYESFTNGLVSNVDWVTPGSASSSNLVLLLRGTATGSYAQMPLSGAAYANDPAAQVSITEVEAWIDALPENGLACSAIDRPENARLPTEAFVSALASSLGYSVDELRANVYPDATNAESRNDIDYSEQYNTRKNDRFLNLGGPDWMGGKARTNDITRGFQLELVQMAIGHCRRAIISDGKTAMFRFGSRNTGMTEAALVRSDIEYMHLRFLSEPADSDDTDALVELFAATEAASNSSEAWVSVCAALIRDPLFVLY